MLIVIAVLGLIFICGVITYPYVLSSHTLNNLKIISTISSYGYSKDFEFIVGEGQIEIKNVGPMDVTLFNSSFTISLDGENITTILIANSIKIPSGSSYNHTIAPPDLVIKDESQNILGKIKGHFLNYTVILNAHASCGEYEGPINKSFLGHLVFLHPLDYELPLSLQHGMLFGTGVNETFMVYPSSLMLPQSFKVGYLSDTWINREHYWGLSMRQREKIRFLFNATKPVSFQLTFSDNPDFNYWCKSKILIDLPAISFYSANFTAPRDGLYVFIFKISQKDLNSTVILNGIFFWP
jgi:hypothetical protein